MLLQSSLRRFGLPLLLIALAGCGKHVADEDRPAAASEPLLLHPDWQTFESSIEQPGWIKAFEQAPLYPKINGYVSKVNVEIGSRVKQGDVLAVLWVPELDEGLKRKEALVEQAKIEITQADKALAVAGANLVTAQSLVKESKASLKSALAVHERWKSESARMEKLVSDMIVDKQVRDEILNQYRSAEAGVELADAKIRSAEANEKESAAKIAKAEADLAAAKNRLVIASADYRSEAAILKYAEIKAPFDGIVTDRLVDTGHLIQAGGSASSKHDAPMFTVCRMDIVRIFLDVPEGDAVSVRDGAEATVRVQALKEKEFKGKVAGTSWALETKQRTLRVEIDFDNPTGELRPGMYAYARIRAKDTKALAVPAAALEARDGAHFCFVVEKGKAVRTAIKIGARQGAFVEVLQRRTNDAGAERWESFTGNEWIAAPYPSHWVDGQAVKAGN